MTPARWTPIAWTEAWRATEWSVWLTLFGIAIPYMTGLWRLWHRAGLGRGITPAAAMRYALGVVALLIAIASPLDVAAEHSFAAHMTQHLLLIAVAAPLLVTGGAEIAWAWLIRPLRLSGAAIPGWTAIRRVATLPLLAFMLHTAAMWGWHFPPLYRAALRSSGWHAVEHASFLGTALLLWHAVLQPRGSRRSGYGIGVLLLLATAMQSGALGALLVAARTPWYGDATSLGDQQVAGLIMWIVGGTIYSSVACGLFLAWLQAVPRSLRSVRVAAS